MEKKSKISLIVPTYKQEKIIIKEIDQLHQLLRQLPFDFEIIVVVDGFVDNTYTLLKRLRRPYLKVIGYEENKGKGFAVRYGMLQGSGDIIGFMVLNHFLW